MRKSPKGFPTININGGKTFGGLCCKPREKEVMKQLELRSYPRAEIAEVLSVNINDSKHFARNIRAKLDKWGYGYEYGRQSVQIISKPETPAERLAELLYRGYGIDVQIHPLHFACFIAAFTDIDGFDSMPWAERVDVYYKKYGVSADQRTLRNWCSQLIQRGVISKYGDGTAWKTEIINGRKLRLPIDEEDDEERRKYYSRRKEIFAVFYADELKQGLNPKEAKAQAWSDTYNQLWAEFRCCYYYCKTFTVNAFDEENVLFDIFEIVDELAGVASATAEASTYEFHSEWYF